MIKKRRKGGERNPEGVGKKRVGNVARLPKEVRDEINRMIEDGAEYDEIAAKVGRPEVKMGHLITWRQGGYQDWLREQERLTQMRLSREFAQEIVRENQGKEVQEAAIQIATSQIYEMLMKFNPTTLRAQLRKGSLAEYARVVAALVRLSDGGLKYERYRAEVAEKKEKLQKMIEKSEGTGMTEEELVEFETLLNLM